MLLELNVKDIALVRKASVAFGEGVNILTGETGTGKSVIIDSAMLALGAKAHAGMIREGAEYAYAELIFELDEKRKEKLAELGINADENGMLIVSRKLMPGKSISRINDETVTLATLKKAAALLLDVYGQNEYYDLNDKHKHLEILDEYAGADISVLLDEAAKAYHAYREASKRYAGFDLDEKERARRIDLLSFELNEIDAAELKEEEESELAQRVKKLNNARSIMESVSAAKAILEECDTGRAVSELERAMRYDDKLEAIYDELMDTQAVMGSCIADLAAYSDDLEVDEAAIDEAEERLDTIRRLELKYGQTVTDILSYREKLESELALMQEYDIKKEAARSDKERCEKALNKACDGLSKKRKEYALKLCKAIETELKDLGFEDPKLSMEFKDVTPSAEGSDDVCFMSALNPGEKLKCLQDVASGGELSRVMLAIKTVLAATDDMPTLIFDEIDTGISGRTAQKVAEKLDVIGMKHQVICVSHLPQIAAMADTHFVISKTNRDGRNITDISKLDEQGAIAELARLLGGSEITKAVSDNAAELLKLAKTGKKKRRKA